jgi:hypothetical protein
MAQRRPLRGSHENFPNREWLSEGPMGGPVKIFRTANGSAKPPSPKPVAIFIFEKYSKSPKPVAIFIFEKYSKSLKPVAIFIFEKYSKSLKPVAIFVEI